MTKKYDVDAAWRAQMALRNRAAGATKTRATFDVWLRDVNAHIERMIGAMADDLPDAPYSDWYDDELTPRAAAKRAIRYAMSDW